VSEPFVVGAKSKVGSGGGILAGSSAPSQEQSLSSESSMAQRMREVQEEENTKARVKDIIRRDLLFFPTFRNALQGNSHRTDHSLKYAELYERYKDLYAPLLYQDLEDNDWLVDGGKEFNDDCDSKIGERV